MFVPLNPNHPKPIQTPTWWILMDSVLYNPDGDTLHGAGCPNSGYVQHVGHSVCAWCWILADSGRFLAKIARGYG